MTALPRPLERVVAIGDSFTEGMGDELDDGSLRGWADLTAGALAARAAALGEPPVAYANLAIRGRRLGQILHEQLPQALALEPDLVLFNGGGNDLMRPRVAVPEVAAMTYRLVRTVRAAGVHLYLCSGPDPSAHLPLGTLLRRRGRALTRMVRAGVAPGEGVTLADNFSDPFYADPAVWAADGLHLNARGHRHAAANALRALGLDPGELLGPEDQQAVAFVRSARYYREHVLPWVGRRLTRRSSGDGRAPKRPDPVPVPGAW